MNVSNVFTLDMKTKAQSRNKFSHVLDFSIWSQYKQNDWSQFGMLKCF